MLISAFNLVIVEVEAELGNITTTSALLAVLLKKFGKHQTMFPNVTNKQRSASTSPLVLVPSNIPPKTVQFRICYGDL